MEIVIPGYFFIALLMIAMAITGWAFYEAAPEWFLFSGVLTIYAIESLVLVLIKDNEANK